MLGLPVKESEAIVKELNILLSNYQVFYQNLRGLHWNIRGKRFFNLHVKFEEMYNDAQLKIDLIAETMRVHSDSFICLAFAEAMKKVCSAGSLRMHGWPSLTQ